MMLNLTLLLHLLRRRRRRRGITLQRIPVMVVLMIVVVVPIIPIRRLRLHFRVLAKTHKNNINKCILPISIIWQRQAVVDTSSIGIQIDGPHGCMALLLLLLQLLLL